VRYAFIRCLKLALVFSCLGSILVLCLPALASKPNEKEASFYKKLKNKIVQCQLCPRGCVINPGKRGYCRTRENQNGTLVSLSFGRPVAVHVDPIEKKPLFHFLPGTTAFSVATAGCNLQCRFCQNWEMSQAAPEDLSTQPLTPEELVAKARASGAPVIAYTYTEPVVFYEYMFETAKLAHAQGLKNCMHSNGYINEEPLRRLAPYLDAANIDLKGFSDEYYAKLCAGTLAPVLKTLKVLKEEGVHIEVTNLLLPGFNDNESDIRKMCVWIRENLGADTPLHFARFFPMYKLLGLNPTPVSSLEKARDIARESGLRYVYLGNIIGHEAEDTYCPNCRRAVIQRAGYIIEKIDLVNGSCPFCNEKIQGVWDGPVRRK